MVLVGNLQGHHDQSDFCFQQGGGYLHNTLVRSEPVNSGRRNLASRNYKPQSFVWGKMRFNTLNRLAVDHACD